MANLFSKKISRLIVITLLAVVVLTLPANAVLALTPQQQELQDLVTQISNCDNLFGICIGKMIAWSTYYILQFVTFLFSISGSLFDAIIPLVLTPSIYDIDAIHTGWTTARDTANLFFIFILLTIAIATILRIETYGAKALLPKLIIAALFINFSLLLTQYVIFSSNILAGFFIPGAEKGTITKSLTIKFLAGLQPNQMFASTNLNLGTEAQKLKELQLELLKLKAEKGISKPNQERLDEIEVTEIELQAQIKSLDLSDELTKLIISMFGVIIFISVAMFVLFLISIMLIVRIVVLWFLMILSPVAFLFWVLPGLRGQANRWWRMLLSQAFWPVAFFFLFGITVTMIKQGSAQSIFKAEAKIDQAFIANITMVLYYILLIVMLLFSLVAAKQMGAAGANIATRGARTLRRYAFGAGGFAGRIALPYAKRATGAVSSAALKSKAAGRLSQVPLARQALRPLAAGIRTGEKQAEKDAKRLGGLSSRERARLMPTLSGRSQAFAFRDMKDDEVKNLFKEMDSGERLQFAKRMKPFNLDKKTAIGTGSMKEALQIMHDESPRPPERNTPQGERYQGNLNTFIKDLKPQELSKFDLQETELQNYLPEAMFRSLDGQKMSELRKSPKNANAIKNIMQAEAEKAKEGQPNVVDSEGRINLFEFANRMRTTYGNELLAGWMQSTPSRKFFETTGGVPKEKARETGIPEILAPSGRPAREELESPGRREPRPRERVKLGLPYIERENLTIGEYKEQQREEQREMREEEKEFKRTKDFRVPPKE